MHSNPRHHVRLLPVALVAIAVLIGGCTGQESAKSYTASVEEEFLFGCTTGGEAVTEDGRHVRSDTTDPEEREAIEEAQSRMEREVPEIEAVCQCTYDRLEKDVPFDDLKSITNDLEREPDNLPANLTDISEACAESEGADSPN